MKMYIRFGAMVATSTILMFALMYLNTYEIGHAFFSETRTYMALLMGACMAMVMLAFMTHMLDRRWLNVGIVAGSLAVLVLSLWLVRSQTTVGDVSYMKAMIPHHSIALLTSQRAQISDPRVRRLADEIIASQQREIAEMKVLIDDIRAHGKGTAAGIGANEILLGDDVPPPDAAAAEVPKGFRAEVVATGLTYPTSVEFDDRGAMYVAESGYSYGDESVVPRIVRITADGRSETILRGPPLVGPINDLLWHGGRMYVSHRGRISAIESSGSLRDLVTGLPSDGDHHNNQMTVGPDGKIYFGQGTATNSGVVGLDNAKMGWLGDHPAFHDFPARDISVVPETYATANPLAEGATKVATAPFHTFGSGGADGGRVEGRIKAGGTILRMNADGSDLAVYAWGLRNPYGVMWSPEGTLFATENGFDVRGSRPIANDQEDIYVIKPEAWYGWPDYAMGLPVTDPRFTTKAMPAPRFLMAEHPPVEQPWLGFPKHSAIAKLDFSTTDVFGKGNMYVAFFGHMSPMTGSPPEEHGGHRVVRIDPAGKTVTTFFAKHMAEGGHGHGDLANGGHGDRDESMSAGPRRLLDVRFAPDGQALYIADFGAMSIADKPRPIQRTGVIWRVVPDSAPPMGAPADLSPAE